MKVVFLAHDSSLSGANLVLIENLKYLKRRGVECKVLFPKLGPAVNLLIDLNFDIEIVHIRWWVYQHHNWKKFYPFRHLVRIILSAWDISKILKSYKPDIFLSNTLTSPVGALAAKLRKVPHVWYIHEFGKEDHSFKFLFGENASGWLIKKLSVRIFLVSNALKEKFGFINSLKVKIIYNGLIKMNKVNPKKYKRSDTGNFNVLSVGRFEPGKNFEDLIFASAEIKKQVLPKELKFTILGAFIQKEYISYLQRLAKELGVLELFCFADYVPDPSEYFKKADLFVITSKKEAFGLVTIEAMNNGLPVIGSNSGANPELIQPGKNGFLYNLKDGKGLATEILKLFRDRESLNKIGENAFNFSLSFNPERSCGRLYDELKSLLV